MKKISILLGVIIAMISSSTSCNKEDDGDKIQCGGDSCLIHECKNHPADKWVWEHCYDYYVYPRTYSSKRVYYYRHNKKKMETETAYIRALYGGTVGREIRYEYDIWNRINNYEVVK